MTGTDDVLTDYISRFITIGVSSATSAASGAVRNINAAFYEERTTRGAIPIACLVRLRLVMCSHGQTRGPCCHRDELRPRRTTTAQREGLAHRD